MTLLRLTRRYADRQIAVPSETLHDWIALRMIEREGMLLNSGITRLAKIQTKDVACSCRIRSASLAPSGCVLSNLPRHRTLWLPTASFWRSWPVRPSGADRRYLRAREHDRVMSYAFRPPAGRPTRVVQQDPLAAHDLEDEDCDPDGVTAIDQFLAETIDGRDPVKALIGYSPDPRLGPAGPAGGPERRLDDRLPFTPVLMDLSNALARWHLPEVEAALLRRVRAGLDGHHPLSKEGPGPTPPLPPHRRGALLLQRLSRWPEMGVALTRRAETALRFGDPICRSKPPSSNLRRPERFRRPDRLPARSGGNRHGPAEGRLPVQRACPGSSPISAAPATSPPPTCPSTTSAAN